jgi:phage/plasmid-associated DNA primase
MWMARMMQQPGTKPGTAIILSGAQGSGKGIIIDILRKIVGKQYVHQVQNPNEITGDFNSALLQCLLLFVDEAVWGGDKQTDNMIKKIITEETITINAKYQEPIQVQSYVNAIFATNNDLPVNCKGIQRRYVSLETKGTYAGGNNEVSTKYFKAIRDVPIEIFAHFLYKLDITPFNPRDIVKTDALREHQAISMEVHHKWLNECLSRGHILEHIQQFQASIPKQEVYDSYATYTDKANCKWKQDARLFWKQLKDLFKNGITERKVTTSVNVRKIMVEFPPLNECKILLQKYRKRGGGVGEAKAGVRQPRPARQILLQKYRKRKGGARVPCR